MMRIQYFLNLKKLRTDGRNLPTELSGVGHDRAAGVCENVSSDPSQIVARGTGAR